MKIITRGAVIRISVLLGLLSAGGLWAWWNMVRMPGDSFKGPLAPLSADEQALAASLRADVAFLASSPRGPADREHQERSADWIEAALRSTGLPTTRATFDVAGRQTANVVAELRGSSGSAEVVVVGAHNDTVDYSPGANDNGSGVAACLAIARAMAKDQLRRTVRFVAFANEEPPFFQNQGMGSLAYARLCHERGDQVVAMLSLETIGYYSDEPRSQHYPYPFSVFYPSTGNFIGFVGDLGSKALVRSALATFRRHTQFPSEGAALPRFIQGAGWSDHWSFWQFGYPAIMVTDTAPFRYPHYHTEQDTPDKLDYGRTARVTQGLVAVVRALAGVEP